MVLLLIVKWLNGKENNLAGIKHYSNLTSRLTGIQQFTIRRTEI